MRFTGSLLFIRRVLVVVLLLCGASVQARAGSVHLLWDPNSEPDLAGYVVLIGTTSTVYTQSLEVDPATAEATVNGLAPGATYYFAVRAFNTAGQQSGLSNEVSVTLPLPPAPPPHITSVSPASGSTAGQQVVTIDGTGFQAGVAVRFGVLSATVESVTPTRIVARTPPSAAGTVNVLVTNPDGQASLRAAAYTFVMDAPVITALSPSTGSASGGTQVTLTGSGFTAGLSVVFGSAPAVVSSVTATSVVAVSPSLPPGPVPVTVTLTNGQSATAPVAFTAVAPQPQINAVSPAWGSSAGGTALTITGANFLPGATVMLGAASATVTSVTPTMIMATTPAHIAGPVGVTVVNPGGGLATSANAYTYVGEAPTITAIEPAHGPVLGGNSVIVHGVNFSPGTAVTFDGIVAPVLSVSPTMLAVRAPERPAGPVTVSVHTTSGQTTQRAAGYHYDPLAPSVSAIIPAEGTTHGGTVAVITGVNFGSRVLVTIGGLPAPVLSASATTVQVATPAHPAGRADVRVRNLDGLEATMDQAFRYDDPDADPTYVRYFAEGVQGTFFRTRFALANPHDEAVEVRATFTDPFGQETNMTFTVPAGSRSTLDHTNMPALASEAFGSRFEATRELGIDRTVVWDPALPYGAHSETGIEAPRTAWYLAEGATHSGFNLFYLLQNPTDSVAEVLVRYLLGSGQVIERVHFVGARARTNIWVNKEDPALASAEMSAHLVSVNDVPIVVERSMYLNKDGQLFTAGHNSAGVADPATRWFLAEGATGDYFDTFILVANPSATPAQLQVTYLLPTGEPLVMSELVPANSRFTIWVDQAHPALAATDFSTVVESTNGVPVIVERAMWWPDRPGGQWTEAHNSAGATSTAARWLLADGSASAGSNTSTYALVANTSPLPTTVRFTLLGESGPVRSVQHVVGASSRFSIDVAGTFSEALNRRFSLLVESLEGAPLVVERASYWDAGGVPWSAGTNSLAMPLRQPSGVAAGLTED
jgi:hypothetical protein